MSKSTPPGWQTAAQEESCCDQYRYRKLSAYYNEESGVDDTNANKGIFYKYPVDGTNQMLKVSAGKEAATPGTVSPTGSSQNGTSS